MIQGTRLENTVKNLTEVEGEPRAMAISYGVHTIYSKCNPNGKRKHCQNHEKNQNSVLLWLFVENQEINFWTPKARN